MLDVILWKKRITMVRCMLVLYTNVAQCMMPGFGKLNSAVGRGAYNRFIHTKRSKRPQQYKYSFVSCLYDDRRSTTEKYAEKGWRLIQIGQIPKDELPTALTPCDHELVFEKAALRKKSSSEGKI